mmetsp:Transcript_73626/g.203249  ORF Transcript_73626/g.203249 Transcript_73626/m.203249 type:complete len:381 (-) Transcript_73626:28-1170(-)
MILDLRPRGIPGEVPLLHHHRVVRIALAPAVWRASADVGHGPLVAVLKVGPPLPVLGRQLLAAADDRGPVDVRLWYLAARQGAQVGPQGLVKLPKPPLLCHCRHLDLHLRWLTVLAVPAGAQRALHANHLVLAPPLKICHQVDLEVLWAQLRRDRLADLVQGQLVEVLHTRLRDPGVRGVHHAHEAVHRALLQGLLHSVGLRLVGLLCPHEGRQLPARLYEEQVQELQHSDEAVVRHREAGVHVGEFDVEVEVYAHQVGDRKELDLLSREVADRSGLGDGPHAHHGCTQLVHLVSAAAARDEQPHRALRLVGSASIVDLRAVGQHELHDARGFIHLAAGGAPSCECIHGLRSEQGVQVALQKALGHIHLVQCLLLGLVGH